MDTTSDVALVEQAKKGDQKAFNKLVMKWYERIYNFTFKFLGEHDLAMEVSQKTFIAVNQHLIKLKQPDLFKSWVYQIATN
ncbi:MAG: sigma factor, partial [Bacteroidota bacterium]